MAKTVEARKDKRKIGDPTEPEIRAAMGNFTENKAGGGE